MLCISKYSEGINTKVHMHALQDQVSIFKLIIFIMVIYTGFLYVLYFHIQ